MLQAGRTGSIPDEVTGYLNWPNRSGRILAVVSTRLLTEMTTRNLLGLSRLCRNLWAPRRLESLWASKDLQGELQENKALQLPVRAIHEHMNTFLNLLSSSKRG
jgi:hypothetical protein